MFSFWFFSSLIFPPSEVFWRGFFPLEYTAPPLSIIAMFFLKVELFTINISGGWDHSRFWN